jgi:hypothetical protein
MEKTFNSWKITSIIVRSKIKLRSYKRCGLFEYLYFKPERLHRIKEAIELYLEVKSENENQDDCLHTG